MKQVLILALCLVVLQVSSNKIFYLHVTHLDIMAFHKIDFLIHLIYLRTLVLSTNIDLLISTAAHPKTPTHIQLSSFDTQFMQRNDTFPKISNADYGFIMNF